MRRKRDFRNGWAATEACRALHRGKPRRAIKYTRQFASAAVRAVWTTPAFRDAPLRSLESKKSRRAWRPEFLEREDSALSFHPEQRRRGIRRSAARKEFFRRPRHPDRFRADCAWRGPFQ